MRDKSCGLQTPVTNTKVHVYLVRSMYCMVVVAACLTSIFSPTVGFQDSVKLSVFCESYDLSSIDFIVNQLYKTWKELKNHLILEMVPFGLATERRVGGHKVFSCNHGPKECIANMLHACAIHRACDKEPSILCPASQLDMAVEYIQCVMKERDQEEANDECAGNAGLRAWGFKSCAKGKLVQLLMGYNSIATRALTLPPVTFLPYIIINDTFSYREVDSALSDLRGTLCRYIPQHC